jgi:tRNA G18 (ribose-2'-O)-methylase SpoU
VQINKIDIIITGRFLLLGDIKSHQNMSACYRCMVLLKVYQIIISV